MTGQLDMQQTTAAAVLDAEAEYRAIERALLESARGRWFLAEHGRRARRLDSALLEDALGRLQSSLREPPALLGRLKAEMAQIADTVAAIRANAVAKEASLASDVAPAGMPRQILNAAENIHEIAWDLQAQEIDADGCQSIARHAAEIYALSHAQAATSRRAQATAAALDQLAARIAALAETVEHELSVDSGATTVPPADA